MKLRRIVLMLVMLVGLQLVAAPMRACSQGFPEDIQGRVLGADLVLVGMVTGSSSLIPSQADYTIQVDWYYKGMGPDAILLTGFGSGGGDCLNQIAISERWIFFVDGNPETDEVLQTSYLYGYDAIIKPDPDTLKTITSFTNAAPMRPHWTPIWTTIRYWTYSPLFKVGVLAGVPLLLFLAGAGIRRMRRQAKRKD
jgi:hypothetical protein